MVLGFLIERVGDLWQRVNDRLILGHLSVQHAHRNGYRSDPFEAFWAGILAKSPALRTARVEISTVSIRSIAAHAFGQTRGTNDSPAAKEVGDLFERLFGMATDLTGKRKKKSDEY